MGRRMVGLLALLWALLGVTTPAAAIGFDAESVFASVVVVFSGDAVGSGFTIGGNCIVTNAHVIDDPSDTRVVTRDGQTWAAVVVVLDDERDVAALQVADAAFPVLAVADPTGSAIGDDVYAVGAPENLAYTLTRGIVSARQRMLGQRVYIQTDAAINPGSSGGPLLTDDGAVLGMNSGKLTDSEGLGLAIPMTVVCDVLTDHGVALNGHGNVNGTLTLPAVERPDGAERAASAAGQAVGSALGGDGVVVLAVLFCLSLTGNLMLLLRLRRRRNAAPTAITLTPMAGMGLGSPDGDAADDADWPEDESDDDEEDDR